MIFSRRRSFLVTKKRSYSANVILSGVILFGGPFKRKCTYPLSYHLLAQQFSGWQKVSGCIFLDWQTKSDNSVLPWYFHSLPRFKGSVCPSRMESHPIRNGQSVLHFTLPMSRSLRLQPQRDISFTHTMLFTQPLCHPFVLSTGWSICSTVTFCWHWNKRRALVLEVYTVSQLLIWQQTVFRDQIEHPVQASPLTVTPVTATFRLQLQFFGP